MPRTRKKVPLKRQKLPKIDENVVDIDVNFITARFEVGCKLNLAFIAMKRWNTDLKDGVVWLYLNYLQPGQVTARIFASGKITVSVKTSDTDVVKKKCRNVARLLQKMGFPVKFYGYRIYLVKAVTKLHYRLNLPLLSQNDPDIDYEPEIMPCAYYSVPQFSTFMSIQHTGTILLSCKTCVEDVFNAVKLIEEKFYPYRVQTGKRKSKFDVFDESPDEDPNYDPNISLYA